MTILHGNSMGAVMVTRCRPVYLARGREGDRRVHDAPLARRLRRVMERCHVTAAIGDPTRGQGMLHKFAVAHLHICITKEKRARQYGCVLHVWLVRGRMRGYRAWLHAWAMATSWLNAWLSCVAACMAFVRGCMRRGGGGFLCDQGEAWLACVAACVAARCGGRRTHGPR